MEHQSPRWALRARNGAISGFAGGIAMAIVQELDLRAFRYCTDDFLLLGGAFGATGSAARRIGIGVHALNSTAVGAVYGLTAANVSRLPGPMKGMIFAMIENATLYPVLLLEDRHPLVTSGELASYRSWTAFTQEVLRHLAFGAATGAVYALMCRHPS